MIAFVIALFLRTLLKQGYCRSALKSIAGIPDGIILCPSHLHHIARRGRAILDAGKKLSGNHDVGHQVSLGRDEAGDDLCPLRPAVAAAANAFLPRPF